MRLIHRNKIVNNLKKAIHCCKASSLKKKTGYNRTTVGVNIMPIYNKQFDELPFAEAIGYFEEFQEAKQSKNLKRLNRYFSCYPELFDKDFFQFVELTAKRLPGLQHHLQTRCKIIPFPTNNEY
jgi:hypothetical protein